MSKPRRQRSDSTAAAVEMAAAAVLQTPLHPPSNVPLDPEDMPFFASVLVEFPRSEWTAHQLELAAMLARTMADLEREQRLLREEGAVARTDRGTPVCNPRKIVVQMHAASILSFRRSLALNARAQGDPRDLAASRKATKAVEREMDDAAEDDLIARPQ